jgi:hypothetical protein
MAGSLALKAVLPAKLEEKAVAMICTVMEKLEKAGRAAALAGAAQLSSAAG